MSQKIVTLFPIWAIILSIVAYFTPAEFAGLKPAIIPLLSLVRDQEKMDYQNCAG